MNRHLFLDLESTVISPVVNSWAETSLVHINQVNAFIAQWRPDAVHVFSFALHTIHDLAAFNQGVRPRLEAALGLKIQMTPTMEDDLVPLWRKTHPRLPDDFDTRAMCRQVSKQDAFRAFVRECNFKNAVPREPIHVALLDDCVYDEDFAFPKHGIWPTHDLHGTVRDVRDL